MPVQSAYSPVIWTRSPFDEPYGSSPGLQLVRGHGAI